MTTLVIAEAGVNHNGDLETALKMVDVAAESGADMVKFQTFRANDLVTREAAKADYQMKTTTGGEGQLEMLRQLELSEEMHHALIKQCDARGIQFLSTGFDIRSLEMLLDLGMKLFKIPSGEITNLPLLRFAGQQGLPVILSTGMATLDEVGQALQVLEGAGTARSLITVLHCTSEYPAPVEEVNLQAMHSIRDEFDVEVGYSDHTLGTEVAIAAVALGAKVIEKHFTLDREMEGPDHRASLEPKELKAMIAAIRHIEVAMGNGIKSPTAREIRNLPLIRKSLVAARNIRKGDTFDETNLAVKRPGHGISPMMMDDVIGKKAPRDFEIDELICL